MQFATLFDPDNQAYFVRIEGETATPIGRAYDPVGADPLRVMLSNGGEPASAPSIADDFPIKDARYLPAVTAPEKIIAIGLNYKSHAEEVGQPLPKDASMSWCKYTSSLLGHNEPIRYRRRDSEEVDYEVELTVVMGRRCRDVSESAALDYVFGYTVCNDVTARNRVFNEKGWIKQLCTPKSFDTFHAAGTHHRPQFRHTRSAKPRFADAAERLSYAGFKHRRDEVFMRRAHCVSLALLHS